MRPLLAFTMIPAAASAAAPAVPTAPAVGKLIDQLGDDDDDVRKAAEAKLTDLGEEVVPALLAASKKHADVDVRCDVMTIACAIHAKNWGPVKAIGPGAGSQGVPVRRRLLAQPRPLQQGRRVRRRRRRALILYEIDSGKEVGRVLEVGGARPGLDLSADGK